MITTSFANNRGRAVVLLFIAGATLFAFGALFERYFVASSSPPSQRWRKSESQQHHSRRSEDVEADLSFADGGERRSEVDYDDDKEEVSGRSLFPPPSPLKRAVASSESRGRCSIYSCVQTKDKNKFSFSADQLQMAIEKEAHRASALVRVNVGDALKYTMKRCVLHPHNEFEIPRHKRGEYDTSSSKMEDLKTAMHRGIPLFPIVAHPLIWNVTDGVGVGHGHKVPSLPENYLVSMRDLEKTEKIDEKYREKIESLMNAAKYWIDEAHALYEDRGGAVESNEEVKKVWAIWSGLNGFNYAYRLVAAKLGVGVVSFENAPFWRLIVDTTTGVASSQGSEKSYYWKYKDLVDENAAVREALDYKEKMYGTKGFEKNKEKWDMHVSPSTNLPSEISARPKHRPLVVFLGHVYSDTSVTYMIESGFNDQVDVIINTAFWCVKNNVDFVVKMHPAEKRVFKRRSPTETKLVNDPRWHAIQIAKRNTLLSVDGTNRLNTYKLVDAADVVVTVVSSSGLESVIMGKQVILTGAAFYGKLGFTRDASNPTELKSHLYFALRERLSSPSPPSSSSSSRSTRKVALSPSLYKKAATFFYVLRHYATVGRDDVDEIARRIVRACVPAL